MYNLILVRHGQSQWNLENRFTGWYDAELTKQGVEEAKQAGSLIKNLKLDFNFAFTSFDDGLVVPTGKPKSSRAHARGSPIERIVEALLPTR